MASIIHQAVNASRSASNMITNHPYYPLEVEIASYLANEWSVPALLSMFAALCAAVLFGTVCVVDRVCKTGSKKTPAREKAAVWWFVLCTDTFRFI